MNLKKIPLKSVSEKAPGTKPKQKPPRKVVTIDAWSFSRWHTWMECPFRAKLRFIEKLKEPDNKYQARGTEIHAAAEAFITRRAPDKLPELAKYAKTLHPELKTYLSEPLMKLRKAKSGLITVEAQLGFTNAWEVTAWFGSATWCRVKMDATLIEGDTLVIYDWKTGKIRDQHEQLELYGLAGFIRWPEVKNVSARFYYADQQAEPVTMDFTRKDLPKLKKLWGARVEPMMADTKFAPRPGSYCRNCHFSRANGGPCKF